MGSPVFHFYGVWFEYYSPSGFICNSINYTILTYWHVWIMLGARRERFFYCSKDESFIGLLIECSILIKGHLHFSDENFPARFIVIGYYSGPLLGGVISYLSSRTPESDLISSIPLVL